jgi:hypothetical protein
MPAAPPGPGGETVEPGPTGGRFPAQAANHANKVANMVVALTTERIRYGMARGFTKRIFPSVQTPGVRRGC